MLILTDPVQVLSPGVNNPLWRCTVPRREVGAIGGVDGSCNCLPWNVLVEQDDLIRPQRGNDVREIVLEPVKINEDPD